MRQQGRDRPTEQVARTDTDGYRGTVRCPLGGARVDLADGRTLAPGDTADDVDLNAPHNAAAIGDGRLLVVPDPPVSGDTIAAVLAHVGDDPERAAEALAVEVANGDRARATLVRRLEAITTKEATP